jgi:hypothetical protein
MSNSRYEETVGANRSMTPEEVEEFKLRQINLANATGKTAMREGSSAPVNLRIGREHIDAARRHLPEARAALRGELVE